MSSMRAGLALSAVILVVGACGGGASASSPPSAGPTATLAAAPATPAATETPSPTATEEASPTSGAASPVAIDPCTLLTQAEAEALIGQTLSAGVEQDLAPDQACSFKSSLTEVKLIVAPPAPDTATANSYWDAQQGQVPAGVTVTELTFFDRSAYATGAGAGIPISALFVIDGQYFFDLYCGFPACTQDASVGTAEIITGRLP